jgi:hypothetical protein
LKFAYIDESGMGEEPYLVVACVVTDGQRMRLTKASWRELFARLSDLAGHEVSELKSSDLYNGNRDWRPVAGPARAEAITAILEWLRDRHHQVFFAGVSKDRFREQERERPEIQSLLDPWCAAMTHVMLQLQRVHGRIERNKGNTVVIADHQVMHRDHFLRLVTTPPPWTDAYYNRARRQAALEQIVDVPYFADSEHVLLIQVADLVSFVLRRRTELHEGMAERFDGERDRLDGWTEVVRALAQDRSRRWPVRRAMPAHEVFASIAPPSLCDI